LLTANLYDIYHCCVYSENSWWWTDELPETRSFIAKINLRN